LGGGGLIPILVCTNKTWSISSAYENLRGQHPLRAEMYSLPRKIHLGGSILANKFFFVCGPKFTGFFPWNAVGIAVDQISFRFWTSGVVSEIFAIKVESCQKSRWILDVFSPSQILGAGLPKVIHKLWPLSLGTSYGKCFVWILPLAPKL